MPLTADQVEAAFVETAREQQNGEPFDWHRLAAHLNEHLGKRDRVPLDSDRLIDWNRD